MRPFLLFIYSSPNIVGSVLGLLGLVLFFVGLIKSFWLAIVIGLYAIGYVATPRRQAVDLALKHELNVQQMQVGLRDLVKKIKPQVSEPVLLGVQSVVSNLEALLPHLDRFQQIDHNLHVVKKTATDYLPEMLETYLKLPPAFARFHTVRDGKTPREMLLEQLKVLDDELSQILLDVNASNLDDLEIHGRFLKDKFGGKREWV